jgi:hypothetical protein
MTRVRRPLHQESRYKLAVSSVDKQQIQNKICSLFPSAGVQNSCGS